MNAYQTETEQHEGEMGRAAVVGAVAGIVGGIVMGVMLQLGTEVLPVLGLIIGEPAWLWGWLVNLGLGAFYGVVFGVTLAYPAVQRLTPVDSFIDHVLSGLIYGTLVAMVTIALLPFIAEILGAFGPPTSKATDPDLMAATPAVVLTLGHLAYGLVVGGVYAALQREE